MKNSTDLKEILMFIKQVPDSKRDKKFWKLAKNTLEEMYKDREFFVLGLFTVLINEYLDLKKIKCDNNEMPKL